MRFSLAFASALLALPAQASLVLEQAGDASVSSAAPPYDFTASFPCFDPALGTLKSVRFFLGDGIVGSWRLTNPSATLPVTVSTGSYLFATGELFPGLVDFQTAEGLSTYGCGTSIGLSTLGCVTSFTLAPGESRLLEGFAAATGRFSAPIVTGLEAYTGTGRYSLDGHIGADVFTIADGPVTSVLDVTVNLSAGFSYEYEMIPEPVPFAGFLAAMGPLAWARRRRPI